LFGTKEKRRNLGGYREKNTSVVWNKGKETLIDYFIGILKKN
jgi:hypothetical protein